MPEPIRCYHFNTGVLANDDDRTIIEGGVYGFTDIIDALQSCPSRCTCLDIVEHHDSVVVGEYCRILRYNNCERIMHEFSLWCAEQVRHLMTDPRSRNTLDVKRRWLAGQATDKELRNARSNAYKAVKAVAQSVRDAWLPRDFINSAAAKWTSSKVAFFTTSPNVMRTVSLVMNHAQLAHARMVSSDAMPNLGRSSTLDAEQTARLDAVWASAMHAARDAQRAKLLEMLEIAQPKGHEQCC